MSLSAVMALLAVLLMGVPAIGLLASLRGQTAATPDADRSSGLAQPVTEYDRQDRGKPVQLAGPTLTKQRVDVADLRGDVVVVNVWGSWCAPCRTEAPVLADMATRFADRDVAFLGVNVKDNTAAAQAFEAKFAIPYPSIADPNGTALLSLTNIVPASVVPVTLVLDRQGRVAARVLGAVQESTLRTLLDSALAEPV